jgi:hypothetical protein
MVDSSRVSETQKKPSNLKQSKRSKESSIVDSIYQIVGVKENDDKFNVDILEKVDFGAVLECDPQRKQEYTEVFTKVIRANMELDPNTADRHMESQEYLQLRVLVRGEEASPLAVRVMLTSENDV